MNAKNVTIEFWFIMRIFYGMQYTISELVRAFSQKGVPVKFKKKLISWVISGTSSSKLACNPRHPSRNISSNHRNHLMQPSWRQIFSVSNNQKTRVDRNMNSDYKASYLTEYTYGSENETQRDLLEKTNGNIEMRWPSAAAMMTMDAATTIVRFHPVLTSTAL